MITDHDALKWMLNISEPQMGITRWRLCLGNFDFTVTYRTGFNSKVPHELSRCTPEDHEDVDIEDEITTFMSHALVLTRPQVANRKNKE